MAVMPVEIIEIGDVPADEVACAIRRANHAQSEFRFIRMADDAAAGLRQHAFRRFTTSAIFELMEDLRSRIRGYHPHLITIMDSYLEGSTYSNLFGSHQAEDGMAVITTCNVPDVIIPAERLRAYFVYYLARHTLSFICPDHRNHEDTRGCYFDRKVRKRDILDSMRSRALCDVCRKSLLSNDTLMSPRQFEAIDALFSLSGRLLDEQPDKHASHPRAFIGSSSEGLPVANKLQALLEHDLEAVVWNQGTVFALGDATLEALETAVLDYEFGIFVFTPDDELNMRGETKPVARDNVIFELGLFVGKLTRRRAFAVHPRKGAIALPSDLHGITTATYDPDQKKLAVALGPVCERIREAVARMETEPEDGLQAAHP